MSFVTQAGQGAAELAAGHGGQEQCREPGGCCCFQPSELGLPSGTAFPACMAAFARGFPLLLGEGGGGFFVSFPSPSACSRASPRHSQVLLLPTKRQQWGVQGWRGGTNQGVDLAWLSFLVQYPPGLGCDSPGNRKFNSSHLLFSGVRLCSVLQHPRLAPDPNHAGKGDSRVTPQCHRHRDFSSKEAVTSWPGPADVIFICF